MASRIECAIIFGLFFVAVGFAGYFYAGEQQAENNMTKLRQQYDELAAEHHKLVKKTSCFCEPEPPKE